MFFERQRHANRVKASGAAKIKEQKPQRAKWPKVKYNDAKIWHEWLTSQAGLDAITSYRINGEELFFRIRKAPTN